MTYTSLGWFLGGGLLGFLIGVVGTIGIKVRLAGREEERP